MKLLIVESPGKLKTLRKILGPDWLLEASVGHTTELAHDGIKNLGFDIRKDQVVTRYVPRGSRGQQVLSRLRAATKRADQVFLAMDPDREGESIAWHLIEQLKIRRFVRVSYTQITANAVKAAIEKPRPLDLPLVHAQRARQCLDKLVGFEVSPLLWNSSGGKSAGRVQSATLHLICERERERLDFRPEDYWTLHAQYGEGFTAQYEPKEADRRAAAAPLNGGAAPGPSPRAAPPRSPEHETLAGRVKSAAEAKTIELTARRHPHVVTGVEDRRETRLPPPPFITSSLQQMAGVRLRLSPQKTMQIAQELYEGVGGTGLITYMRTDAVTLSPEFINEARQWLAQNRPNALAERPPVFRVKAEAQGAHEAIRPTAVQVTPEKAREFLNHDQFRLYELIWNRAVASQCRAATLAKGRVDVEAGPTRWVARGMRVIEPGYLEFWKNIEDERELPALKKDQVLNLTAIKTEKKTTQPPSRYSEAKLVQLMEKLGIGRPSTYASTVLTLKEREYAVLDKSVLAPTALGMATDQVLLRAMPDLVNIEFTAKMEDSLDRIAEGRMDWQKFLFEWNESYLQEALIKARTEIARNPGPRVASRESQKPRRAKRRAKTKSRAHIGKKF